MRKPLRRNKFNAVWSSDGKNNYDSLGERKRWNNLQLIEKAGGILELEFKPAKVMLLKSPDISFRPDYKYIEDGRLIYEDYKPRPFTGRENVIMKLWQHFGPAPLKITTVKGDRFTTRKMIMPKEV